jgi:hypothetical protein
MATRVGLVEHIQLFPSLWVPRVQKTAHCDSLPLVRFDEVLPKLIVCQRGNAHQFAKRIRENSGYSTCFHLLEIRGRLAPRTHLAMQGQRKDGL